MLLPLVDDLNEEFDPINPGLVDDNDDEEVEGGGAGDDDVGEMQRQLGSLQSYLANRLRLSGQNGGGDAGRNGNAVPGQFEDAVEEED
jgi:hypothetical protein